MLSHRHRLTLIALLALAVSLRALVPAGFMPDASDGGMTLGVCNGIAGTAVPATDGDPRPAQAPCPFAVAMGDPVGPLAVGPTPAVALAGATRPALDPVTPILSRAPLTPRPRGPPAGA